MVSVKFAPFLNFCSIILLNFCRFLLNLHHPCTNGRTIGDHRWNLRWATRGAVSTSTGGPPVATAKCADAIAVVHRWGFGGTSLTTGGLRLISNPGIIFQCFQIYFIGLLLTLRGLCSLQRRTNTQTLFTGTPSL